MPKAPTGVGKALLTAFAQCVPDTVQHINLCGMHPTLSPKALTLCDGLGFTQQTDQLDKKRLDTQQPAHRWLTFRQLLTIPMQVSSELFTRHTRAYAEKARYKATDEPVAMSGFTLYVPPTAVSKTDELPK